MNHCIPKVLIPTLENHLSLVETRLPHFLNAFYVVGSIALHEFNPHFSDVDFVALTSRLAMDREVEVLRNIHTEVEQHYPTWKLSGVYLLWNDLGKPRDEMGERLVFHKNKLKLQSNHDATPVTWWILKQCGIPVLGPDPCDLPLEVNAKVLVAWTQENMNAYWKKWTTSPDRFVVLLTDWGIQWAVLGIARQIFTVRESAITPKRRAGEYALSIVPPKWHRILREAIRIRTKASRPLYHSRLGRMVDAVQFLRYMMRVSNDPIQMV